MRKLIKASSLFTAFLMCLSICGCNSNENDNSKTETITETVSNVKKEFKLDRGITLKDIHLWVSLDWKYNNDTENGKFLSAGDGSSLMLTVGDFTKTSIEQIDMDYWIESVYHDAEILNKQFVSKFNRDDTMEITVHNGDAITQNYVFYYNGSLYSIGITYNSNNEKSIMQEYFDEVIDSITFEADSDSENETDVSTVEIKESQTEKPTELPTEKPDEKPTESPTEKETIQAYQNGMFKVGTDIEAGEYMLFATSSSGYLCVSSDANQDDIIFNENFGNNLIATFEDREYVELSRCMAVPFDPIPNDITDLIKNYIDAGAMYKVGKNIEAGEYKLECTSDTMGYYCIYSNSRHDDIISNDNFENNTYVNVSDGEYLLLSRCKIIK